MTIYSLLGAFLFSAYIVYDVHLLIAREYPPTATSEDPASNFKRPVLELPK